MKKHEIYFSEKEGISLTNANFIANMGKELYRPFELALNNLSFVTTRVKLLAFDSLNITKVGKTDAKFIADNLEKIARYKSLLAWLREAINAWEELKKEVGKASFEYFDIHVPEKPVHMPTLTEDDIKGEWSVKQMEEYLRLEQYAATYGVIVHPDGAFSKARIKLLNSIDEPNIVDDEKDRLYMNEITCAPEEVDKVYLAVQQEARGYQARLNAIKAQIKSAVTESERAEDRRYDTAYELYETGYARALAMLAECKSRELERIGNLKIVIPNHLKDVYEEVNKSGKLKLEK